MQDFRKVGLIIGILLILAIFLKDYLNKHYAIVENVSSSIHKRILFIEKTNQGIDRGDIIVFRFKGSEIIDKGTLFIKRVICLPGDRLEVDRKTRSFYCNGKFIGKALKVSCEGHEAPLFVWNGTVPKGKYFVLGEDKCSYDSRYWGFVDRNDIVGRALFSIGQFEKRD